MNKLELIQTILACDEAPKHSGCKTAIGRKIIIAHRGWVFVGDASRDGSNIVLTDASVIRVWGTTEGLGQLALKGKQPGTKLDPCGTVRLHELAVVAMIDCPSSL